MVEPLQEEIRALSAAYVAGDLVAPEQTLDLLARLRQAAPGLQKAQVGQLRDELLALIVGAREARDRLGAELDRIRSGRHALHSYASLRDHHTGQRVYKHA